MPPEHKAALDVIKQVCAQIPVATWDQREQIASALRTIESALTTGNVEKTK